jgi:hypothetical protein
LVQSSYFLCWSTFFFVYDKHIITCHFSYRILYQPSFIYHPLSLSALGLIKGMIWIMPCNNLYISHNMYWIVGLRVNIFHRNLFLNVVCLSFFYLNNTHFCKAFVDLDKFSNFIWSIYYTDISCLGGIFAKNTSRETKNFLGRMAREI